MAHSTLVFRSKVGMGIVSILFLTLGGVLVVVLMTTPAENRSAVLVGVLLVLLPVVAFVVWIYRTTVYRIESTVLTVHSGPLSWKVDLPSVRRLRATRSLLSAPALSLDRIAIEYGGDGTLVVSPADKAAFIRAVIARSPRAVIEGLDEYR